MPGKTKRSTKHRQRLWQKTPFTTKHIITGAFILVFACIGIWTLTASHAATMTQLGTGQALYPRAIRLQNSGTANGRILASVSASSAGGVTDINKIYESTNSGTSFHQISTIQDPQAAGGIGSCCSSIYELPQQVGQQPAGTLLFATAVGLPNTPTRSPAIRVWKSGDHGYTWSYLSTCATAPSATAGRGLWEPEFSVDSRGDLDCYFSDDSQQTGSQYDQILASATSTDGGVTWGAEQPVVAIPTSGAASYRPGMATVRKLPNGTYFMAYELCGANIADVCSVHYRTSADGWNWGDPTNSGTEAQTPDGKRLYHAPTIAWISGSTSDGRILLIGQTVESSAGKILNPNSGSTIFANGENGAGQWYELPAPVKVAFTSAPTQSTMVCNNYSSSLVPSADGTTVLELASMRASNGDCDTYSATGTAKGTNDATGITSGKVYRLQSVQSNNCLDVTAGSTASGANVEQWTCNSLNPQNWTFTSKGSGYYTLTNKQSGKCLDVYKSSTAAGANVDQWTCNGTAAQLWRPVSVGNSYYSLLPKPSSNCLDIAGGSMAAGANVQQYTCNNLSPQIWELE